MASFPPGSEMLRKLDLTVNFVSDLTSVESLVPCRNLRDLYLTGNPCSMYEGYREYVVATLPQLEHLDGIKITRTERILATQARRWRGLALAIREPRPCSSAAPAHVACATSLCQRLSYLRSMLICCIWRWDARVLRLQDLVGTTRKVVAQSQKALRDEAARLARLAKKNQRDEARGEGGAGSDWYCNPNSKGSAEPKIVEINTDDESEESDLEIDADAEKAYWEQEDEFTPESRTEAALHQAKVQQMDDRAKGKIPKKKKTKKRNFFKADGAGLAWHVIGRGAYPHASVQFDLSFFA